jgi:DMSO/TMAO reductase YedYZ molybdopterin-dependent catalytic subunit
MLDNPHLFPDIHRRDRRQFLRDAGLATLPLFFGSRLPGDTPGSGELITRVKEPQNLEFPFDTLDSFITPNERFYVRNHFAAPTLDAAKWRLTVGGAVGTKLELSLDQLTALTATTMPATLECAGNGRSFVKPPVGGVQWATGAVSTAEWTGIPLATVLKMANVKPGAVDVVLEGSDSGEVKNEPKPDGVISFARSLPLEKAMKPEVLLAYKMNGKTLPNEHGFPVRAVVGGWFGMASVKWLRRIVVTERPFKGYWQTTEYSVWEKHDGVPVQVPLSKIQVKASIARPRADEVLPAGKPVRIHGAAWGGAEVKKVEISFDKGATWVAAKLLGDAVPWCWRLWEYEWKAPKAGSHVLMVRATDANGDVQPMKRDLDRRNYAINHSVETAVTVK